MVTLSNNLLTVKINAFGAEVSSVVDKKSGDEFIWQADEKYWGRHAPVLFPIVGRLKENQYEYAGEVYEMSQHGFARDSLFEVQKITKDQATFSLTDNQETFKRYPFKFELLITYTLKENRLTVTYQVKNRSAEQEMYYGIGGHPAFNVSQTRNKEGHKEFHQIYVRFEPDDEQLLIPLSAEGLLRLKEAKREMTKTMLLTHELFRNDALIYQVKPETAIVLTDRAKNKEIRLNLQKMDYVGIWSPYPKRAGFVCLEPWAGVADDEETSGKITEKHGVNQLRPEEIKTHGYTMAFSKKIA